MRWLALSLLLFPTAVAAAEPIDFDRQIAPLLAVRCLDCHFGKEAKGELNLSMRATAMEGGESGKAIVPGKLDASLIWEKISDGEMPPKKPLPEKERALIKQWIESGAEWGSDPINPFRFSTELRAGYDWWALQQPSRPVVPNVTHDWPRSNPIDAFVQAKLAEHQLSPSSPAERRALIRRLSIDLVGLPPTPEEVKAYLADVSPEATAKLIDRLLASPHYGERWARHWLDVIRFGESQGFERDKLRTDSWRYRDWVVNALNRDLPYDEFVRMQVAGDVLTSNSVDGIAATGFLVAGPYDEVGKTQQSAAMKAVVRQDELEDLVSVVGQTFLGLTVNCARCHDHKFDPILHQEYYSLAACLAGVEHGSRPLPREVVAKENADRIAALRAQQESISHEIAAREAKIRQSLATEQRDRLKNVQMPTPLAEWTFDENLRDARGGLHGTANGEVALKEGKVVVEGKTGFVTTEPIAKEIGARTLVAWAKLANLSQRGGATISLQTLDGNEFDAIVFGEQEPGKWMAGSNGFVRYKTFGGPAETEAGERVVQIAIVYDADGTITGYRDGAAYGSPYKSSGLKTYAAGKVQVAIGIRHSPAGGNKMLAGAIDRAMLFDRALSPEEVAVLAGAKDAPVREADVVAKLSDSDRTWRAAAVFERDQLASQIKRYEEPTAYAVMPQKPHEVQILARGEPNKPLGLVSPDGISSLSGFNADFQLEQTASDGERRVKLAEWLSDKKNPLTARVIVNRLWHYHFGVGLVETPNDFGFNGGRPSHRELLDWLAIELMENGWSLKHIQRLIVSSATYQQASLPRADAMAKDAGNRLLWRKTPQRLDAETLRDAMLFTSGALNGDFGGPGFTDFTTFVSNSQFYEIVDTPGHVFNRRSLYRTWIRSGRSPLLDVFDCPDPSTKTPARAVTTTPLQALSLLNNSFVLRTSDTLAARVKADAGDELASQLRRAYWLLYSRKPTDAELKLVVPFAREHGLAALMRVLVNANEFVYVD